jgi:hypothetical protein
MILSATASPRSTSLAMDRDVRRSTAKVEPKAPRAEGW